MTLKNSNTLVSASSLTLESLLDTFAELPAAADKVIFVTSRGDDNNDGSTLKTALATLPAAVTKLGGSGLIQLGYGVIDFSTTLDLSTTNGITLQGIAGNTAGATPATVLRYNGTGTTSAINGQESVGLAFKDIMFLYTSSSFTGRYFDLRGPSQSTTFTRIEDCYVGGAGGIRTCSCLIDLTGAHSTRIMRCSIRDSVVGIRGKAVNADYSNAISVEDTYFRDQTTAHISNPGDGWFIKNPTVEPLSTGAAGFIICDSGVLTNSLNVVGGWAGDITNAGIMYDLSGNNINIHTFIGGNTGSTGVKIRNNASGIKINSRFDTTTNGIDVGGVSLTGWDFSGSSFVSVTNPVTTGVSLSGIGINSQTFTTSGTWTMPIGASRVRVQCWGGGGGGGAGAREPSGTLATGGAGAGGGGYTDRWYAASALTSTIAVTVGAGGVGGAAVTTDSTVGNTGSVGGGSNFGSIATYSNFASGGQPGAGGNASGAAAAGSASGGGTFNGGAGSASSATGGAGVGANGGQQTMGGASGGGITTGAAASAGGVGGPSNAGGGGGTSGAIGAAGGVGPAFGAGGGGGGSSVTGAAGAGGVGGVPGGGGGGGGASLNGNASGKGGNGGAGLVIVDTYF